MKKVLFAVAFGLIGIMLTLGFGSIMQSAPNISYVYSSSMEPTIHVGDGFFVIPSNQPKVGDIVLYRPLKLNAKLITHRVVAIIDGSYMTQGDNSPASDQSVGEPLVSQDRIVGKVLTINSKPLLLSGFGKLVGSIQSLLGNYATLLSAVTIAIGVMIFLKDVLYPKKKRKSRNRWRLRDVYQAVAILVTGITILSILIGSSVNPVKYLISENPGTDGLQVVLNKPGEVSSKINNNGLIPVWSFTTGIYPLKMDTGPVYIAPLAYSDVKISIEPQSNLGWYQGYVQVYNIPTVLPKFILAELFTVSPYLALFGVSIAIYLWLILLIKLFEKLFKVEGWIPLQSLKDKVSNRRIQHFINSTFGRRRLRR